MADSSITDMTISTADLAAVLGLTRQRVGQLGKDDVLKSAGRNQWDLVDSVRGYIEYRDNVAGDELKAEKVALMRARTQALTLQNERKSATITTKLYQAALVDALALYLFLRYRAIPTWLYSELLNEGVDSTDARRLASTVNGWLLGMRNEVSRLLTNAVEDLNSRNIAAACLDDFQPFLHKTIINEFGDHASLGDAEGSGWSDRWADLLDGVATDEKPGKRRRRKGAAPS